MHLSGNIQKEKKYEKNKKQTVHVPRLTLSLQITPRPNRQTFATKRHVVKAVAQKPMINLLIVSVFAALQIRAFTLTIGARAATVLRKPLRETMHMPAVMAVLAPRHPGRQWQFARLLQSRAFCGLLWEPRRNHQPPYQSKTTTMTYSDNWCSRVGHPKNQTPATIVYTLFWGARGAPAAARMPPHT